MWNSRTNQPYASMLKRTTKPNPAGQHCGIRRRMVQAAALLLILTVSVAGRGVFSHRYVDVMRGVSDQILVAAEQLRHMTNSASFSSLAAEQTIAELRDLIQQYESTIVFAESPYEGEILLGATPPGDSTWLELLSGTRYDGPLKEIRIRRTGYRSNYLRINDIEITAMTPHGRQQYVFNRNGRVKLYRSGVFKLSLPNPMKVMRVRININHESTGLEVTGVPLHPPAIGAPATTRIVTHIPPYGRGPERVIVTEVPEIPSEVLLGTTPPGHSTWLETLCSNPYQRPIREIQIRRTGNLDPYLRINDIELTYMTPHGPKTEVFNKNARAKLYTGGAFRLTLPRPMMRITRMRVRIDHKSTGLEVYGVY